MHFLYEYEIALLFNTFVCSLINCFVISLQRRHFTIVRIDLEFYVSTPVIFFSLNSLKKPLVSLLHHIQKSLQ